MPTFVRRQGRALVARPDGPPARFEPASGPQKEVFRRRMAQGCSKNEARIKAGISWAQLKHAMASDPDLMTAIEESDDGFLNNIEEAAFAMAKSRDGAMVRWILEKRRPERYGNVAKLDITHRFQDPAQLREMSDEDILVACQELGIEAEL